MDDEQRQARIERAARAPVARDHPDPDEGRRYAVGVSSFEMAALGTYAIRILNDGTLTPL